MGRRKGQRLTRIEARVLLTLESYADGEDIEFYGWELLKFLDGSVNHSSLYRSLIVLERFGYLASRMEDPELANEGRRPRRKLIRLTPGNAPQGSPDAPGRAEGA